MRAVALLLVAALPVAFNAWVDPGRLVTPRRSEREIARALAAGANVTDFVNYDDRAIEKYLVPLRRGRVGEAPWLSSLFGRRQTPRCVLGARRRRGIATTRGTSPARDG